MLAPAAARKALTAATRPGLSGQRNNNRPTSLTGSGALPDVGVPPIISHDVSLPEVSACRATTPPSGNCNHVAHLPSGRVIRDSRAPAPPVLRRRAGLPRIDMATHDVFAHEVGDGVGVLQIQPLRWSHEQ